MSVINTNTPLGPAAEKSALETQKELRAKVLALADEKDAAKFELAGELPPKLEEVICAVNEEAIFYCKDVLTELVKAACNPSLWSSRHDKALTVLMAQSVEMTMREREGGF